MDDITRARIASLMMGCLAVSGCGGAGTAGIGTAPIPTPPPVPPTPPPTPPGPVSVSSSTEFTSVGSDIKIRFDAGSQKYQVMLPGQTWASLSPETRWDFSFTTTDGTKLLAHFSGGGEYAYTGFAGVHDSQSSLGDFAYGIATAASAIPVTGVADYTAKFSGRGGDYYVGGTAQLSFDFAKGALSGSMSVEGNDPAGWGPYNLGQYDFVRTVYTTGSPSFSGDLSARGNSGLGGNFSGLFTGPAAQELMGKWQLQFRDIYEPNSLVTASGVMVGKQ